MDGAVYQGRQPDGAAEKPKAKRRAPRKRKTDDAAPAQAQEQAAESDAEPAPAPAKAPRKRATVKKEPAAENVTAEAANDQNGDTGSVAEEAKPVRRGW